MWTLFINAAHDTRHVARNTLPLLLLLLAGCATNQGTLTLDGAPSADTSKYAQHKTGGAAANSDTVHIPPVPHDPKVEDAAREAMDEYARALKTRAQGNNKQALVMFRSLAERYPMLSGPWVNVGLIRLEQEEFKKAQQAFENALEANDANPYAHNGLGLALRELGQFKQAREHYEQALVLDPKYARAHFNLAVLGELYLQDLNLALAHFRAYQNLQKEEDQNVANWIVDLERRAPDNPGQPVANGPVPADSDSEVN